jgi:GT2 family glycosyltransferase
VIGEDKPICWPSVGLAMPTINNAGCVTDAVLGLSRCYPGHLYVTAVANGCDAETLDAMRSLAVEIDDIMFVSESETNLGFGQGANRGLELLKSDEFDYYGVINDDILPDPDCVCELVAGMIGLEELGLSPGVIGPVSNYVNGLQQVEVGPFQSYSELLDRVASYRRSHHASVTQVRQLRGLMMLIHPACLEVVGGFDPIFGLGNYEDDDHNLRTHLSGFSLWIADGAFLYHHGSTTFKKLDFDYESNIQRNSEALAKKWQMRRAGDDWTTVDSVPEGVSLIVPLSSWQGNENRVPITINGESVDLIQQASDLEFAAWIMTELKKHPREVRRSVIEFLKPAA